MKRRLIRSDDFPDAKMAEGRADRMEKITMNSKNIENPNTDILCHSKIINMSQSELFWRSISMIQFRFLYVHVNIIDLYLTFFLQ